jgi:hypothetical protein
MIEANNDEVICPNCVTQFRAIPVNIQDELVRLRKANLDCVDHFNAIREDYDNLRKELAEQAALVEKCMVAMNENADRGKKAEEERDALQSNLDLATDMLAARSKELAELREAETVQEPVAWLYPEGLAGLKANKCWTAYPSKHDECTIPLYGEAPQDGLRKAAQMALEAIEFVLSAHGEQLTSAFEDCQTAILALRKELGDV